MLDRLVALVPPPARRTAFDWEAVELELGAAVPPDLRDLLETYGPGTFEPYLELVTPGQGGMVETTQTMREVHAERAAEGPIEAGIVWADDQDALSLHLLPDGRVVAVDYEEFEAWPLPGTPADVLVALHSATLGLAHLDEQEFRAEREFTPLDPEDAG